MAKLLERMRVSMLFDRGVRLAEAGSFEKALALFEEVIDLSPADALAHANAGFCYYKLGKHDAALEAFERAKTLDPDDAEHAYDLGCVHHGQGRKESALEYFREALRLEPEHADAYSAMEQVRIELGLPAYDKRVNVQPELADIMALAGGGNAAPVRKKEPAPPPSKGPWDYLKQGEECFEAGKVDEALEAWDEAARLDPNNPQIHNNRAAALFELGRHQDAIDACSMALRIKPDYAIAHMTRGEIYASLGNRDAVMREYTALNQLDEEMAVQLLEMIQKDSGEKA